jgi:F-type H+-transporting ATPase subunit beta
MDATQVPLGMIIEVHGPVVVECAALPPLHQALYATNDSETFLFEVHQQLDAHHVRANTLHYTSGLERGVPVYDTNAPLHVPVTQDCLGRALDSFGTWPVSRRSRVADIGIADRLPTAYRGKQKGLCQSG